MNLLQHPLLTYILSHTAHHAAGMCLDDKINQRDQLEKRLMQLESDIEDDISAYERAQEDLNDQAFDLLLHTPCREYSRLLYLLD